MGKGPVPAGSPAPSVKFSLMPRGLKDKLTVAFSLMSVIPLLVLVYIVTTYVFPGIKQIGDISLLVAIAGLIALLGLAVTRGFVMPVVRMAAQAQAIAKGEWERQVDVRAPDEVGSLGMALNQITQRVRDNMSQLKVYGEQTKHLNLEINRRVLTMSHLLQVSSLISQSAKVEEVTGFILGKLTQLEEAPLNCLLEMNGNDPVFSVRACCGADSAQTQSLQQASLRSKWLAEVVRGGRVLVVDEGHPCGEAVEFLKQSFGMTHAVFQPMVVMGQGIGLLISANKKEVFSFQEDCLDLLSVFGKQAAIALENDLLSKRAEELKVVDELTGLYNAGYMKSRFEEEIRRAARYHRPCSLVLLEMDDFEKMQDLYGMLALEGVLHQAAELLKGQVTEVDRVGRMGPDRFAVILPERNKREAIELAGSIQQAIEKFQFTNGPRPLPCGVTVCAGVSENPLDGSTAEELFSKAEAAIGSAKRQGKNKVLAA